MKKKGLAGVFEITLFLLLGIFLLLVLFKYYKDFIFGFKDELQIKENARVFLVYDKINRDFLSMYKDFCLNYKIDCVVVQKDQISKYNINSEDRVLLFGYKTNPNKYIIGITEYPLYFTDFDNLPSFIDTDNINVVIENSSLLTILNQPADIFLTNISKTTPYKMYLNFFKQGTITLCLDNMCSNYIKILTGSNLLVYNLNGNYKEYNIFLTPENNTFSVSVDKDGVLIKVNDNLFNVPVSLSSSLFDHLNLYNARIDKLGYFLKTAPPDVNNVRLLDDNFGGADFVNILVTFNFLPYKTTPPKKDLTYSIDLGVGSYLEDYHTLFSYIRDHYFPDFYADFDSDISIPSDYKYILVSNYEDLNKEPYIGFINFDKRRFLIKTELDSQGLFKINDGYTLYTIYKGNSKYFAVPLSEPRLVFSLMFLN